MELQTKRFKYAQKYWRTETKRNYNNNNNAQQEKKNYTHRTTRRIIVNEKLKANKHLVIKETISVSAIVAIAWAKSDQIVKIQPLPHTHTH